MKHLRAVGHLVVVVLTVTAVPSAATLRSSASQLIVFARPLGCGAMASRDSPSDSRIQVQILSSSVFLDGPDTRFPYKTDGTLEFSKKPGGGWGEGCGCNHGIDCELCAAPDIRVTLRAGEELTWTMEKTATISAGPANLRLTLYWYGGASEPGAALQKMSGTTDQELAVAAVDDRCFVASAVPKKAG